MMDDGVWQRLGGWTGGLVTSLVRAPTVDGPARLYATTATGVYRSADAGRSWTPLGVGQLGPIVQSLAVAAPEQLFAGTASGLYGSPDGGANWQQLLQGAVSAVAVVTGADDQQAVFAGTATDGLLRTTDGGRTWTGANPGLRDLAVQALALSPNFAYDGVGFVALATGLKRTRNGGKAWRAVDLPALTLAVQCLALSPDFARDGLAFAGTETLGLLRSSDGGTHWMAVPDLAGESVLAVTCAAPHAGGQTVAAATSTAIAVSRDAGVSWQRGSAIPSPALGLSILRDGDRDILVAGLSEHGVVRSVDGGQSWAPANTGLHSHLLHQLAAVPRRDNLPALIVVSLTGNHARSLDGEHWAPLGGELPDVTALASASTATGGTFYAATAAGLYRSADEGVTWRPVAGLVRPLAIVTAGVAAPGQVPPLAAASAAGDVCLSDDNAATWFVAGQPFGVARITGLALSPAYARDHTVFAATSEVHPDGARFTLTLWRSTDGGQRWAPYFRLQDQANEALIVAATLGPRQEVTAVVGLSGRVLHAVPGQWEVRAGLRLPVWRGVDLCPDRPVAITAVTHVPGPAAAALLVATNAGVFVSRDGGASFQPWSDRLQPAAVVDLAVVPMAGRMAVYALGPGGALWRRDQKAGQQGAVP